MNIQPNCAKCGCEKFVVIEHVLYANIKNHKTNEDSNLQIKLLCCDKCGAVIGQFDRSIAELKTI